MNRKALLLFFGVGLIVLFTSPLWMWHVKSAKPVNVLIVDKTVPDETYAQHKGLVWLLNHLKYTKDNGQPYREKEDYVGFVPGDKPPKFQVREMPNDLSPYDVIYIADSYGVYANEYGKSDESSSDHLYGGMTIDEVSAIKQSLFENNQTLVAEFNTFGSTEHTVRKELYTLLNLEWTGWVAKAFHDLSSDRVPQSLKTSYESKAGKRYDFKGMGVIFINEHDDIIVLSKEDLKSDEVKVKLTNTGEQAFQIEGSFVYENWFDVIIPGISTDVHAQVEVQLSKTGEEKLKKQGLPTEFPAVVYYENKAYDSYYFAGDFAALQDAPSFYKANGLAWWQNKFAVEKQGRTDTFYWKAYVPMMSAILDNVFHGEQPPSSFGDTVETIDGMNMPSKVGRDFLQVYQNGKWEDVLIKGVNMGIAKPGYFPGETAITKQEYARWFQMISEMNANSIRVYTIHPPAFYEALYEHNRDRKDPLYLFHGVWVNEEEFVDKNNAFHEEVTQDFKEEIARIVDLVHGNAVLEERPGHASGTYTYDISQYVLGWILGVEWDPLAVVGTNEKNSSKTSYVGTYIEAKKASPFEVWLAEMMDFTATYEAEHYQTQHPLSFTNWVTTDLLEHPMEPLEKEDLVSVDPNVIQAKHNFHAGLFASYHIYPYYPDFLNLEEKYTEYVDHRGQKNNYAGYLNDLKKHHNLPIVVAEFGIPASRGMTHKNVYGMNQGFHSEQEQGKYVRQLFEDIVAEQLAGGLVFTWQDEWFKRTWNTMDYDNPDQRPFWDNIQTNEQHYGLLSFDPQTKETLIQVDGDPTDWERRQEKPVYQSKDELMKNVFISSDERGLYVRIDFDPKKWKAQNETYILLDTIKNQGQSTLPGVKGIQSDGIDFVVEIKDKNSSRVIIDSYYDTYYYHYGELLNMIPKVDYAKRKNNGVFHPIRLALNQEMSIEKDGKTITYPFEEYETGKLTFGNGNPHSKQFNSLSDYFIDEKTGVLELRLPWLLINVKDPSQKEIMGDIWSSSGVESSETIEEIYLAVAVTDKKQNVIETLPKLKNNTIKDWFSYTWDNWEEPHYHERLKLSYYMMQEAFDKVEIEK